MILATLDTKAEEAALLVAEVERRGHQAVVIDTTPLRWSCDDDRRRAALIDEAGPAIADRVESMLEAGLAGVVAVGGATGSALAAPVFARLPLGMPKVLVSPVASGETSEYVGDSDVVLVAPVVDFVGRNAYADFALARAAHVVTALADAAVYPSAGATHVAVSAFGVTSPLVAILQYGLRERGLHGAVFAATGTGGNALERFVRDGLVFGVVDVTTSELSDELCGGVLAAGPERLRTAARCGIPQIVMPGALDFINFREPSSVPERYAARARYEHTPVVTLVRTSIEENVALARTVAERLCGAARPATLIVPLQGFSLLSAPGGPFEDSEADAAFIETLRSELGDEHRLVEIDAPINSDEVADAILEEVGTWLHARVA